MGLPCRSKKIQSTLYLDSGAQWEITKPPFICICRCRDDCKLPHHYEYLEAGVFQNIRPFVTHMIGSLLSRGLQRDVVNLGRPIAPSYMSPNEGGGDAGPQPMSTALHRSPNKLKRSNSIFNLCFYRCIFIYIMYSSSAPDLAVVRPLMPMVTRFIYKTRGRLATKCAKSANMSTTFFSPQNQ